MVVWQSAAKGTHVTLRVWQPLNAPTLRNSWGDLLKLLSFSRDKIPEQTPHLARAVFARL